MDITSKLSRLTELRRSARLLVEDKVQLLKGTVKDIDTSHDHLAQHKDAHSIIQHFADHADPSPKKAYTQWVVNQYRKKHIRQEDHPRVKQSLENFDKYKGKLDKKDINQYHHINDVDDAVEPHLGKAASNKEAKAQVKSEGADKVYDDGHGTTVHHIKTEEAAKFYAKGTKWCTGGDHGNMFNHYNKQGPIYIVHHPKGKAQFHFETSQFANPKDETKPMSHWLKEIPSLKHVTEFKGKHPAFDSHEEVAHRIASGHKYPGSSDVIREDGKEKTPKLPGHALESAWHHHKNGDPDDFSTGRHIDGILSHPNTPHHVQREMVDHIKKQSESGILSHTRTHALSENRNLGHSVVEHLIHHNDAKPHDLMKLGDNPSLTHEHIDAIRKKTKEPFVHEAIANNPKLSPHLVHEYATGTNHIAAMNAIRNPNMNAGTAEHVYTHHPALHTSLAMSPHTPEHILHKLANKEHETAPQSLKDHAARLAQTTLAKTKGKKK